MNLLYNVLSLFTKNLKTGKKLEQKEKVWDKFLFLHLRWENWDHEILRDIQKLYNDLMM